MTAAWCSVKATVKGKAHGTAQLCSGRDLHLYIASRVVSVSIDITNGQLSGMRNDISYDPLDVV